MEIRRIDIHNFRGICRASILLPRHAVLIGDNNVGKTTLLEAINLVLGPDRLNHFPPIDEHDFFEGKYMDLADNIAEQNEDNGTEVAQQTVDSTESIRENEMYPKINIEVVIINLSEEQKAKFGNYSEWWDQHTDRLYVEPDPAGVDAPNIVQALRVTFIGRYDQEEDDFEGKTYFTRSICEDDTPVQFRRRDKQICGFLYLRSLRTGRRALSLERGSLLDIILRLKEVRPQMWETTLDSLTSFKVADNPELGVSDVLESISTALAKYVPQEWGTQPHLKVSNLTREHLRRIITAFIATGDGDHAAPFDHQGTGTINMLVLAMLSQIAEDKQNVIFAMEEPETAIPPYAQKSIVHEVRNLSSQAIFTSHSPYVLEEFNIDETVVLSRSSDGALDRSPVVLPSNVKLKRYRQEFRTRFCECLLARRILIAEGATEATALPVAARRLSELRPDTYVTLEALGICIMDAGGQDNILGFAKLFRSLGKRIFSVCDRQSDEKKVAIEAQVDQLIMHEEVGFEDLIVNNTNIDAMQRFSDRISWPQHILNSCPSPKDCLQECLREYFKWSKGNSGIADFLDECTEDEIPQWIRQACLHLKQLCELPAEDPEQGAQAEADISEEDADDNESH